MPSQDQEERMNIPYKTLALCAVIVGGASVASATELLVNGDFENQPNWGNGFSGDAGYTGLTGGQIPGWTIEAGHGVTVHNTVWYPTIAGHYSINTDGEGYQGKNANMYQDFATTLGQQYQLSFKWQGWYADQTPKLDVSLTDLGANNQFYTYNTGYGAALTTVTANFVGNGNTFRLRVKENPESGYNDNTFIVDDFSVQTVPEPATWVALGIGALVIACRRKGS